METTRDPRRAVAVNLAVNLVAPLALYYGLRALGVGQWLALTLGALPPLVDAVRTLIRRRRVDGLGVFTLCVLGLSVAGSFLTGSPRFLLAKDGWLTGLGGAWILLTLRGTPFYLQACRAIVNNEMRAKADLAWRDSPAFRRMMRVATLAWGVGLVLDAGVRVLLAYTLPIDLVPLISGVQYVVVFLGLEIGTQLYVRRAGAAAEPESVHEEALPTAG